MTPLTLNIYLEFYAVFDVSWKSEVRTPRLSFVSNKLWATVAAQYGDFYSLKKKKKTYLCILSSMSANKSPRILHSGP